MEEKLEIKKLIEENNLFKKISGYSKEYLMLIKLYLINGACGLKKQTEDQVANNMITGYTIKSCANENYDYLPYVVNCKQKIELGSSRFVKDYKIGQFLPKCKECKLKEECIKFIIVNFIYEINKYNQENSTNIGYLDVINEMLAEPQEELKNFTDKSIFEKVDFYDLIFIKTILQSKFIYMSEFNEETKKAKFNYIKLDSREGYVLYINKLYDFYKGAFYSQIEIDVNNFNFEQGKEETKREYIYKIAAIYSYYMEHDKLDIIKALEEYLKDGCGLINSERSYYFYAKYKNKVAELPYSQKVKQTIINLFNYVINYNYNGNTPYIPINILMYTEDKESVENITRIISDFMWFFNFLPENKGFYKESMNDMILDRHVIGKIYYNLETKEQRKGTLIIENFENLMYTDDLNCNMIMNLLTDQLERCKGICTVIYGKKETIGTIIEKHPKLNYKIFDIKLELDELDIDNLYKVTFDKLSRTERIEEKAKTKLYNYIKSSYSKSEVKEMDYISELYTKIILDKNKTVNADKTKMILESNIPDVYNTRNLGEILEELNSLVGLYNIKNQLDKLIHLLKFNKKVNMDMSETNLHMVFTGNPGTGKTTVARIVSDILYNLGYIKQNKLVEVSAKDLIAEYVGQTSGKTYRTMKSAFGGVLFIDEAYSILSQGKTSFGPECIATIIKIMEDHKNELVVIFAGYEKEMEEFIRSNPGLKSRIGYLIKFKDYNVDELMEIFNKLLEKNKLKIEDLAKETVRQVITDSSKIDNFGNGRFINNLFQNILIEHAKNTSELEDLDRLYTITLQDINKEDLVVKSNERKRIGF
ncbi:aAA+ family ATPase [Clostridium sp. CAG:571]|nr:aAA+ family ATPase [Clostridium sp. CAG:571]HJJ07497.1 AAA family ATPase [Clostridiaceae bacterium]